MMKIKMQRGLPVFKTLADERLAREFIEIDLRALARSLNNSRFYNSQYCTLHKSNPQRLPRATGRSPRQWHGRGLPSVA
jgi:hypothetical protein